MSEIKVLLADDHTIVRKGLRSLLESEVGIKVIGEAKDGREAVKKTGDLLPDIVVMDITMPNLNGLEATRQIKKQFPEVKVLILTMHKNEEYIFQILNAGASGYILKQAAPEELISAIHVIRQGDSYLSPSISKVVIEDYVRTAKTMIVKNRFNDLTDREREILQLIAEGYSTKQIAHNLYISIKTVETHRTHLMNKLDIHSTAELTRYAIRKGLIGSN